MSIRDKDVFDYEYNDETGSIEINMLGSVYGASIEDYPEVMSRVINILQEVPDASSVVLSESRDYEYSEEQIILLKEIAQAIRDISSQGYISSSVRTGNCESFYSDRLPEAQRIVVDQLRRDPVGAYVEIKRMERHLHQEQENAYEQQRRCSKYFIQDVVKPVKERLEETTIIRRAIDEDYVTGFEQGDREVYREFFHPLVRPNFMLTKFMSLPPERGEEIDRYTVREDIEVSVYEIPDQVSPVYHVNPPEFNLPEEKYRLLDAARRFLASHQPESGEFARPERMRQVFQNIGRDMLRDIADQMNIMLSGEELEQMTSILNRYTSGLGVLEILLSDPKIQDVYINSPIGNQPIYIKHQEYEECETNLIPTKEEAESWATRFRIQSGRPLDEANPVLDTDTEVPGGRARVAIIQENLSPEGLAFAFRRHRSRAWTLPLFIQEDMINPLGAGLLSFIVDGNRSVLFAGTRGAGKCVAGSTEIQLSNGNIVRIEDMVGEFKEEIDDGSIHKSSVEGDAFALSENKNFSEKQITDVWKRESPKELIQIKTESGREIVTTPEHPYFSYKAEIVKTQAEDLVEGDYIATPRKLDVENQDKSISFEDTEFELEEKEEGYIISGETSSQDIFIPEKVDSELAEFLGLIVGDGHINEKKIEFHNSCDKLHERFRELIRRFDVSFRTSESHSTKVTQITCRNLSRVLNQLFDLPFGKKSSKVRVPEIVLKSSDDVLKAFLRGYFAADGYVSDSKREIELSTASKRMSEQLRMVLLRFGITCYTKEKQTSHGKHHRVVIRGKFAEKFAQNIGISHPMKQLRLEELAEDESIKNTNTDIVPGAGKMIKELRECLRMSPKQFRECGKDCWAYEKEEYNVSKSWFREIARHFQERWGELMVLEDQVDLLEEFAEKDYEGLVSDLDEVREILDISYNVIAADIGFTESGMRNSVQDGKVSEELVEDFDEVVHTLKRRIREFESVRGEGLEQIPVMVGTGIITYREISDRTDIPVTSVKNYVSGQVKPPEDRKQVLETELTEIKSELGDELLYAKQKLKEFESASTETAQIMAALKNLKDELNIEREEYDGLHTQTVSTVFRGRYQPSIKTLQKMAKSTAKIYRETVDQNTKQLLDEIKERAESDIFWDEIAYIEKLDSQEKDVYDLTVEDEHNFVANGLVAHNTSLLSASMLEILKKHRIVTVEDTLELPTGQMKDLGYNIESMKSRSVITQVENELTSEEAIRTSLRLGDSALVIGEVRSDEAKTLYEAMRVGAVANFVGGTIHGEDAYAVFDRVVNDLGVERTSFKATDIIVSVNKIKSPDGLTSYRRVTGITEVRKEWTEDPMEEGAFVDLMRYDSNKDELVPTDELLNGESIILNRIAENIKEWKNDWEAVWDNIQLRKDVKQAIVEKAEETGNDELLEAEFVVRANQRFHIISRRVSEEYGEQDTERIFARWKEWLDHRAEG